MWTIICLINSLFLTLHGPLSASASSGVEEIKIYARWMYCRSQRCPVSTQQGAFQELITDSPGLLVLNLKYQNYSILLKNKLRLKTGAGTGTRLSKALLIFLANCQSSVPPYFYLKYPKISSFLKVVRSSYMQCL